MNDSPTIFISAYRNFSVRYILHSDIFKELKKKNFRIVLFLMDNDVEHYRKKFEDHNIIIEPVLYEKSFCMLRGSRTQRLLVLIRKCISGMRKNFRNTTIDVFLYLYGREMNATWKARFQFRLVRWVSALGRRFRAVRRLIVAIETILYPGGEYDHYFEKYEPSLLLVSSLGNMIDPYFMRSARRHECQVISIVHSWDNPTSKDYRGAEPDGVIAWNDIMKEEVSVFHDVDPSKIFVGGIAHWDFYFNGSHKTGPREKFLEKYSLSDDRKVIFYATSSYVLFRNTFDVIEGFLKMAKEDAFCFPVQLLVRLHPLYLLKVKNGQIIDRYRSKIDYLKEIYGGLVRFSLPIMDVLNDDIEMPLEDMYELAAQLRYCDVLLTEYSTVMIEGAIFDKPTVNIALYNYRDTDKPSSYIENFSHIKRLVQTGASPSCTSFEDLFRSIDENLKEPSKNKEQRRRLVEQEITANKGHAGEAIGKYLAEYVENLS